MKTQLVDYRKNLVNLKKDILRSLQERFMAIDEISEKNTARILTAFSRHKLSEVHFRQSSGYAYGDPGRIKLDEIWADVFSAEKALVRTHFVSGTHAITAVLFGILRPGDELISLTGAPYDTLQTVIGATVSIPGSLKEFGVNYKEVPFNNHFVDYQSLDHVVSTKTKIILIQRSCGYSKRKALSISELKSICEVIKKRYPHCIVFVDNCYGEFVEEYEPCAIGADIIAGSLIKNPGGGIASTGGYIAGRSHLVDLAAGRLTVPGIGGEVGASLSGYRELFQGLFMAPHTTAQAVKGAIFTAAFFEELGYRVNPPSTATRSDIIQAIELGTPDMLIAFCRGLQKYSPVDSFVRPEPWNMPGYADPVIMAGGTFVQGSSIELSADAPLRPPYAVYIQGGLSLEHVLVSILGAAEELN